MRHKYQFHSLWLDPTGDRSHERARYYDTDVVVVCFILSLHSFHFFIILCYTLYYVISFYFYPLCEKKYSKNTSWQLVTENGGVWSWLLFLLTYPAKADTKAFGCITPILTFLLTYPAKAITKAFGCITPILTFLLNLPSKSWYESIRLHHAHLGISTEQWGKCLVLNNIYLCYNEKNI